MVEPVSQVSLFFGEPDEFLGSWGIPLKKIKIPVLVVFTVYWGGGGGEKE